MANMITNEIGEGVAISNASGFSESNPQLVGFLCATSTAGTLTITDRNAGRTLLSAMPMTAGQFYPLKLACKGITAVTLGGTCTGLLTFSR